MVRDMESLFTSGYDVNGVNLAGSLKDLRWSALERRDVSKVWTDDRIDFEVLDVA
jgi:hypothetical protein